MIYVKIHEGKVVAACDEDLLGKNLDGFKISTFFYKGEKVDKEKLKKILKNASNVNLVGKEAVEAGLEIGIIKKENVKYVKEKTPHAQGIVL